jgi:predicted peptidase
VADRQESNGKRTESHYPAAMRHLLIASLMATTPLAAAPEAMEWKAPNDVTVKYRWSAPAKIEAGKTYPLVLFLHGAGERGDDNKAQLKHGVASIIQNAEKLGTPVFLIAPQCPKDRWWTTRDKELSPGGPESGDLLEALLALVDRKLESHPIDPKRFHVTGLSMGGYGTWALLGRVSERIASAVPICGGGDPKLAKKFKDVPVWAFHGDADDVVPVERTREMVAAMEKAGGKPKATYYPGVGHNSWTRTYQNQEIIRWMLEQTR